MVPHRSRSGPSASVSRWATPLDGSSSISTVGLLCEYTGELHDAPASGRELARQFVAEVAQSHELYETIACRDGT